MAENEFNPREVGRRIASEYLSKRGWAQERRRVLNRQIYPGFQREEFEAKQKECDQMEQEAEDVLSRSVERWRRSILAQKNDVLRVIVEMLGKRGDLGFFAKRIVERLKRDLGD
jgi:galactokinase